VALRGAPVWQSRARQTRHARKMLGVRRSGSRSRMQQLPRRRECSATRRRGNSGSRRGGERRAMVGRVSLRAVCRGRMARFAERPGEHTSRETRLAWRCPRFANMARPPRWRPPYRRSPSCAFAAPSPAVSRPTSPPVRVRLHHARYFAPPIRLRMWRWGQIACW